MSSTFNGKPCTTIVFFYNAINASDESDITTFYGQLSPLAQHIPKHNVLNIGGEIKT